MEAVRLQPVVEIAPPPPEHAFHFDINDTRCAMRYTYNGAASLSLSVDTQTLMRLFQK